ncbi:hypothetical protein GGQ88_001771 [Novosphingobium hassiacum]|uniref:Uncharacterized protein n=1 Tax=Novosphingobium hassiacum TaxID=173676 RepID=A0A7W5ZZF9_9SPHN|nr:hypothetical protein [Novosphingobium hassiacum]MBB3860505.1 hypothetical protein [Novosphingobium hassiacum]
MTATSAYAKLSAADETRSSMRRVTKCAAEYELWLRRGRHVFAVANEGFTAPTVSIDQVGTSLTNCIEQKSYDGRSMSWLKMPELLFRGQLIEGMFRWAETGKYSNSFDENSEKFLNMDKSRKFMPIRQFGMCVVHLDPANSRAILSGPVAGDEEVRGYAALSPTFSQCVAPGETIQFSKSIIEGAVAEGLLVKILEERRANAQQSVH